MRPVDVATEERAGTFARVRARIANAPPASHALAGAIAIWIITFAVLVVRRQARFWSVDWR